MANDGPLRDADVHDDVEIVESEVAYQGYFRIDRYRLRHRRHDGGWTGEMQRELFERGHVVGVLLFDPDRDAVVLLNQFRIGALAGGKQAWQTEIVAGVVGHGEAPAETARRETREEAGREVRDLIEIYDYLTSPGGTSETMRLYCGIVDSAGAGGIHGLADENEDIAVAVLPFAEAWGMVNSGRIDNAPAIIALQWLALNRDRLRARHAAEVSRSRGPRD